MKLIHDPRAVSLSNRTIKALTRAGLASWDDLADEANRTPNVIRGIDKLGPKGVGEIIATLEAAKTPHTIRSRNARRATAKENT